MQAEAVDSVACTFVPADVKDACDTKVDAAVRHAVQMFEDYISPATVCKPVCPEDLLSDRSRFLHASYPQCSQCRFVATEIRNADCLQHSDRGCAEGELAHVAEQSCKSLPEPFVAECTGFLQSYGGKVLQKSVERYLSRCTACNAAPDACIHSGHCEIPEVTQALSTVPVPDALQTAASSIASKFGVAQAKSVLVDDKKTCEFCRLAVMEVRDKIANPQFQHEVETYAKTVCGSLGDYKNMCVQYVDEYGPIAFALAEDYLDPRTVCGVVHMCPMSPPRAE